jgi:hypothetical protein
MKEFISIRNARALLTLTLAGAILLLALVYLLTRQSQEERLAAHLRRTSDLSSNALSIVEEFKTMQSVPFFEGNLPEDVRAKLRRVVFWQNALIGTFESTNTYCVTFLKSIHGGPVLCLHDGNIDDIPFGKGKRLIVSTNVFVYPF